MKTYLFIVVFFVFSCESRGSKTPDTKATAIDLAKLDTATLAGGCFWCVEASIEQIKGVVSVVSGYAGGRKKTANYGVVSSGRTKHAEAVQVYYDPAVIDFNTLLDIFFTSHDPTQVNRQGPDVGAQYRTAIFYHNETQKVVAEEKIKEIQPLYDKTIATELNPYTEFFIAEEYHQNYEVKHPNNPYILSVSKPKIDRVKKRFAHLLKEE